MGIVIGIIVFIVICIIGAIDDAEKQAKQNAEILKTYAEISSLAASSRARNSTPYYHTSSVNEYQLRRDLRDYYGTAAYNGFPAASMDAMRVDRMSTQELVNQAQKNGFDMSKYTH